MPIITCIIIYAVGFFCFYFSSDKPTDCINGLIQADIRQEIDGKEKGL
jgi:hypothetical protein